MLLSRRAAIATALVRAGERGVSGEAIAADLGISRVAVSKHVATLRELGYTIESTPHVGYRLLAAPDLCLPEEVAPRLRDPMWVVCEGGAEVGSTNDEAKRLARAGAAEGTVVVAAAQTGGRGRFGRAWESPAGGAYVSCVLRPPLPPAGAAPLSLVAALGVARGFEALGVSAHLKWPNDVESPGGKLAGILLEMAAEADRVEWVVLGCGINIAERPLVSAARIRDEAPRTPVADVAACVLDAIAGSYREFLDCGFGSMRAEYAARLSIAGSAVRVKDPAGAMLAEGTVTGIGEDGSLILESADGERRLISGEVSIRD